MSSWEDLASGLELDVESVAETPPEDTPPKRRRRKTNDPGSELTKVVSKVDETSGCIFKKAPESTLALLSQTPKAFIEPEGPKPYASDPADLLVPKPGFISDFVNLGRGTESPTLFMLWGGLWTISAALNRNAWCRWYPKPLWPNLYVLFVAPPGLCKKSTPINFGVDLLKEAEVLSPDTLEAFKNSYHFLTSKGSPEGVYMMLKPEQRTFLGGDDAPNKIFQVKRTSKITLAVSELATFLGKQQYNTGLVNLLTDLYDCKDADAEITRGRGIEPIEEVYATLAGAITPTGLEESIPAEALGGGLISRTILVYQDIPTKIYSRPTHIAGYPEPREIGEKLAWIQTNCRGEYYFTDEAEALFEQWYVTWKTELIADVGNLREDENRKDTLIRKIAMLLRVQEYRPGNEVTVENFQDALKILNFTLGRSALLLTDVGSSDFMKWTQRVGAYISGRGPTTRRELMNRFSRKFKSEDLTAMLNQLIARGLLAVEVNGEMLSVSGGHMKEKYIPFGGS